MELTKENLRDLTMRVRQSVKPWHRKKVTDLRVLSQLEYVDGIIFIRLFRDQTLKVNTCFIFTFTRTLCSLKMRLTVTCATLCLSAIATCVILVLRPSATIPFIK
jgi:hypothetical protein